MDTDMQRLGSIRLLDRRVQCDEDVVEWVPELIAGYCIRLDVDLHARSVRDAGLPFGDDLSGCQRLGSAVSVADTDEVLVKGDLKHVDGFQGFVEDILAFVVEFFASGEKTCQMLDFGESFMIGELETNVERI